MIGEKHLTTISFNTIQGCNMKNEKLIKREQVIELNIILVLFKFSARCRRTNKRSKATALRIEFGLKLR